MRLAPRSITLLLAALFLAVAAQAADKGLIYPFSAVENTDGARYVWFVFGKAEKGYPYTPAAGLPEAERFREVGADTVKPGDVIWWPNYMAVYEKDKAGAPVVLTGHPQLRPGGTGARLRPTPFFQLLTTTAAENRSRRRHAQQGLRTG